MNKYSQEGYERFNLNGVSADFDKKNEYYGLLENKIGFGGEIHEYIGELDLVIIPNNYQQYINNHSNEFMLNFSSLMRFRR